MATIFWDSEGLLLVDIMPRGTTINSEAYVKTLKKLHSRLRRVRPYRRMEDVLLLHENARPHVSLRTTQAITKLWWTELPHPPYSPDLAPSDNHLFGKLKDNIRGTKFEDDDSS
jgi:histone-lysine N-methyltransferase SETMAR